MTAVASEGGRDTHYDILRVAPDGSADDIRAAYRRLAKQFHPDSAPAAFRAEITRMMQRLNEAHDVLSDPIRRGQYDAQLRGSGHAGASPPPASTAPPPPPPTPPDRASTASPKTAETRRPTSAAPRPRPPYARLLWPESRLGGRIWSGVLAIAALATIGLDVSHASTHARDATLIAFRAVLTSAEWYVSLLLLRVVFLGVRSVVRWAVRRAGGRQAQPDRDGRATTSQTNPHRTPAADPRDVTGFRTGNEREIGPILGALLFLGWLTTLKEPIRATYVWLRSLLAAVP